jgi:hypothetical protein
MLKPGYVADKDKVSEAKHVLTKSLKMMEGEFLHFVRSFCSCVSHTQYRRVEWLGRHTYIATNSMSIADLALGCELAQLVCMPENLVAGFPRILQWFGRISALASFAPVHKILFKIAAAVGGIGTFARVSVSLAWSYGWLTLWDSCRSCCCSRGCCPCCGGARWRRDEVCAGV